MMYRVRREFRVFLYSTTRIYRISANGEIYPIYPIIRYNRVQYIRVLLYLGDTVELGEISKPSHTE